MKHHFGDFLDRTDNYWTIVPYVERYSYSANEEIKNKEEVGVLTISKNDCHASYPAGEFCSLFHAFF